MASEAEAAPEATLSVREDISRMNPVFRVEKIDVILHPLDMVSVAVEQLGERIGSLSEHGQAIADALDELFTRSWG